MTTTDEAAIQQLLSELVDAWNRGDAQAYGARYRADGTFTNVNGAFYVGRDEFNRRHEEVLGGYLRGTTLALTTKELRFIRPDVAAVDIDTSLFGVQAQPPGVQAAPDGTLHTCLLLVLVKEGGTWWIAAYHNVWRSAGG
jgi:uncharacterized protein (TIGR02246 family)